MRGGESEDVVDVRRQVAARAQLKVDGLGERQDVVDQQSTGHVIDVLRHARNNNHIYLASAI